MNPRNKANYVRTFLYHRIFSWSLKGRFRRLLRLPMVGRRQVVYRTWEPSSEMLQIKPSKLSIVQLILHSYYILKSFCHLSTQTLSWMGLTSNLTPIEFILHPTGGIIFLKLELKVYQWPLHSVACLRRFNSLNGMIPTLLTFLRLSFTHPTQLRANSAVSQNRPCFLCWLGTPFPHQSVANFYRLLLTS